MRLIILLAGIALFTNQTAFAQQKWNLRTIVDYAMANNLTVKQTEVQAKVAALTYKQGKLSAYPTLGF